MRTWFLKTGEQKNMGIACGDKTEEQKNMGLFARGKTEEQKNMFFG